jgi:peptidase M28-like protein/PDZ domain-containing protein/PA domain-containing protein
MTLALTGRWRVLLAFVMVASLCAVCWAQQVPATPSVDELITESDVRTPLEYLAGDDFRGRQAGSEEMKRAAEYVAAQFKEAGLQPAGLDGTFFQTFPHGRRTPDAAHTHLTFSLPGGEGAKKLPVKLDREFVAFRFSNVGKVRGDVVFVGYGITAPEHKYDDYAGLDVKGKIVLMMRYEPGDKDPESVFDGLVHTQHATFAAKVANAETHGAAGVIMFSGPSGHKDQRSELWARQASAGRQSYDVPVLQITRPVAERILSACGKNIAEIQKAIDCAVTPQSFALDAVRADAEVGFKTDPVTMRNVLALLPGSDKTLADEVVIVGAHLDHLGVGRPKADQDIVYNGADDNASGVAAVLAVARATARLPERPRRSILFMTFDAEEIGLVGSRYYVNHPVRPLGKVAAMLNLDMIGRVRNDSLSCLGVGSARELKGVVEAAGEGLGLKLRYSESPFTPSDSMSFAMKRVPTIFFNSGLHSDYHRVTDEASKINYDGLVKASRLVARTALALANAKTPPKYVQVGWGRPRGPVMGVAVVADDAGQLVVQRVSPGSGASVAGIHVDDVLRTVDGKAVASVKELSELIRSHKAGDTVTVELVRGDKAMAMTVRLGARG